MTTMTREAWKALPKDRKSWALGKRHVLRMDPDTGGTILDPVQIVGEAWRCPKCGGTEWTAHYMSPVCQGVEVFVGEDGMPEEGEYAGDEEAFDAEPNDYFQCIEATCGYTMNPDGTPHDATAPKLEAQLMAMVDRMIPYCPLWLQDEARALLAGTTPTTPKEATNA